MAVAAFLKDLGEDVARARSAHLPREGGALQGEPMLTGKEADQVGGGIDGPAVDRLHRA